MIFKKINNLTENEKNIIFNRNKTNIEDIYPIVNEILNNVKNKGDLALKEYTEKFDNVKIDNFKVSKEEIEEAYNLIDYKIINSLEKAYERIKEFHQIQKDNLKSWEVENNGIKTGQIIRPVDKAGCYVPGGRAFYPSTVLMTVVPAKIAGVKEVVVISPPNGTKGNPATLVASDIAKANSIYKVGGAHGIGALAYGTETIPKVDIIVGPGNIFVTTAKILVAGREVSIDFPAGPSEVLILCDETANPKFVALDFIAQGEHDPNASCIITTTSKEHGEKIKNEIYNILNNENTKRKDIINKSINNCAIVYGSIEQCIELSNKYAPEHLEIITENPRKTLEHITNTGSIFLGNYSPVPVGDYASGTNHVLPTSGFAKMYSGLSVDMFIKKPTVQELTKEGLKSISEIITTIAEGEGLYNHSESVKKRLID